jgi:hypothetical protein
VQIAKKAQIPDELKERVPSTYIQFLERPVLMRLLVLGLQCVGFASRRNGWIYFVGPLAAPVTAGFFYTIFPFNPYRSRFAQYSQMDNLDRRDPAAKRLVDLLKSSGARSVLLRTGLSISASLIPAMAIIASIQRKPLAWSFDGWFWLVTFGCAALCLRAYEDALIHWAFQNWVSAQEKLQRTVSLEE